MSDLICQGYTSADAHLRILTSHLPVFVLLKTSLVLIHNKQSLYFLAYQSIIFIIIFFFKIKPQYEISTNFLTEHLNQSAFWSGDSQAFAIIYLGFQSVESNCEAWLKKCDHLNLMTLSSLEHRDLVGHKSTYILQRSSRSILQVCLIWN